MPKMSNTDFSRDARASLTKKGSSLRRWAEERGYKPHTVYKAANGHRNGPVARKIRKELRKVL